MERIVHVCNGDSTADALSLADLPGEIRVWADALDLGPVLPVDDAEHYRVRGEFWGARADKHAKQLADWDKRRRRGRARRGADPVVRARSVRSARARAPARAARAQGPAPDADHRLDRSPPRRARLPRLRPAQGRATRRAVAAPHAAVARRARRSGHRVDRADRRRSARAAVPRQARQGDAVSLAARIERHLEELPDPTSGMSRTERQLLAAIARNEAAARAGRRRRSIRATRSPTSCSRDAQARARAAGVRRGAARSRRSAVRRSPARSIACTSAASTHGAAASTSSAKAPSGAGTAANAACSSAEPTTTPRAARRRRPSCLRASAATSESRRAASTPPP